MLMRADGRLGREGRLLRTFVGLCVLVGTLVFAPRALGVDLAGDASPVGADAAMESGSAAVPYVVAEGETLWEIAGTVAPGEPRDATVAEIVRLNAMASSTVRPGEQILVPRAP